MIGSLISIAPDGQVSWQQKQRMQRYYERRHTADYVPALF